MTLATQSAEDFLAAAPKPRAGSSPWAARYAADLRRVIYDAAARAPRQVQQHLGPSELGVACDRQVVGKMAALPATNHVVDPWPSIVGTACHAWAADAFTSENLRSGVLRFVAEQKVTPHPDHPGTADLYDGAEWAVVDHKFLGKTSMEKIRKGLQDGHAGGLALEALKPRHYVVQLILYGLGYINLGLPVRRVVLAAYPRTEASLDNLYVWDREITEQTGPGAGRNLLPDVLALLERVFAETAERRRMADELIAGRLRFDDVIATPDDADCYFCPYYRPDTARTGGLDGCPGTALSRVDGGAG